MLTPALLGVALVVAQAATPRAFIQPALVVTVQPATTANHRISPGLGGHAVGFGIGAGGFITPTFGLEGEFQFSGAVRTQQRFTYSWYEDYTAETRDILLNALVRWKPGARWLEVVAGGGLDIVRTGRRDIVRTDMYPSPPHTSPIPDNFTTYHRWNFTGGAEVAVPAGGRAAIVPSFRLRWRGVAEDEAYYGVGGFAMQFGVGLRAMF